MLKNHKKYRAYVKISKDYIIKNFIIFRTGLHIYTLSFKTVKIKISITKGKKASASILHAHTSNSRPFAKSSIFILDSKCAH